MIGSRNLTKSKLSKSPINDASFQMFKLEEEDEQIPPGYVEPEKILHAKQLDKKTKTPFLESIPEEDVIYLSNDELKKELPELLSTQSQQFDLKIHCCFYSIHTTHIYPYLSYVVETNSTANTCSFPIFNFHTEMSNEPETIQTEFLNHCIEQIGKCFSNYEPPVDFRENVYRGFLPIDETSMYVFFKMPETLGINSPYMKGHMDELVADGKVYNYVFDDMCRKVFYLQNMRFSYLKQQLDNGDKNTIDMPYIVYRCFNYDNDKTPSKFMIEKESVTQNGGETQEQKQSIIQQPNIQEQKQSIIQEPVIQQPNIQEQKQSIIQEPVIQQPNIQEQKQSDIQAPNTQHVVQEKISTIIQDPSPFTVDVMEAENESPLDKETKTLLNTIGEMDSMDGLEGEYYFFTSYPFPESESIEEINKRKRYVFFPVDYLDKINPENYDGDIVLTEDESMFNTIYLYRDNGNLQFWATQNISLIEPVISYSKYPEYSLEKQVEEKEKEKQEPEKIEEIIEQIDKKEEQMGEPEEQIGEPEEQMGEPEEQMEKPEEQMEKPEEQMGEQMEKPEEQMGEPEEQIDKKEKEKF